MYNNKKCIVTNRYNKLCKLYHIGTINCTISIFIVDLYFGSINECIPYIESKLRNLPEKRHLNYYH